MRVEPKHENTEIIREAAIDASVVKNKEKGLRLPLMTQGSIPELPPFRQLTLIGANGSGKTRFMDSMIETCRSSAYVLSALEAFYPQRKHSSLPSSIDAIYSEYLSRIPYLRDDLLSEFDKLMFLLFNDECAALLEQKSSGQYGEHTDNSTPTRLDKLIALWQQIFPENQILRQAGRLMFFTAAGKDSVSALRLSRGERAALYYIAGVLYAPQRADIFIDSPTLFLHPAILNAFWNSVEQLRPDCRFIYNTYDVDFVNTRTEGVCIWVRSYDATHHTWDYRILNPGQLSDDLMLALVGTRKPILFIEGDAIHSLDARLYTLIFADYTVRPLASCNKVIEATRAFGDLEALHHLRGRGIVDRDRRTEREVEYLRGKNILVPEVAEIENLFLLESVIKIMAEIRGRNPENVFKRVQQNIQAQWEERLQEQALMHVRHRVKRLAECRIDGRFNNLAELQRHIRQLPQILNADGQYQQIEQEFRQMAKQHDYAGILKVFNHKPMLKTCGVAQMLGYRDTNAYITGILTALRTTSPIAVRLRDAFRQAFLVEQMQREGRPQNSKKKKKHNSNEDIEDNIR